MSGEAAVLDPPEKGVKKQHARGAGGADAGGGAGRGGAQQRVTAETLAAKQREISVSEFFAKNRHLLGFDNPRKALLTTVKEAVDNALDACEEAGILPELLIEVRAMGGSAPRAETESAGTGDEEKKSPRRGAVSGDERYLVIVQDNGPGIVRKQIENIFGKLLYGSKFHRLKMSRGQQGIGISAAGMYGLITTGKPVKIITKTGPKKPAHEVILKMDTSKNRADVVSETEHPEDDPLFPEGHGTRVEIELLGKYFKGDRSVDQYVQLTAIANPHARIVYRTPPTAQWPEGETITFERTVDELPAQPEEIKPHPHGIELGTLIGMLERTEKTQLGGFFAEEFCRVTPKVAQEVTAAAGLSTRTWVKQVGHAEAEKLYRALQSAKVMGPPTNCLSPMGVKTMLRGLEEGLKPEFITASSRPPAVYRGRPFIIEAGIAFGGNLGKVDVDGAGGGGADEPARVYRFANRVPLQYQQSACSSFKAVLETNWKNYGLQQPKGSLPLGPMVVMIHMASVWVPFTSESKEAIADYDEIREEMSLALKECGRKLGAYLRKRQQIRREGERRDVFERYIGEIARAVHAITGQDQKTLYEALLAQARKHTAAADIEFDADGNPIAPASAREAEETDDESVVIRVERSAASVGAAGVGTPAPAGPTLPTDGAKRTRGAVRPSPEAGEQRKQKPNPLPAAAPGDTEPAPIAGTLFGDDPEATKPALAPAVRKKKILKKVLVKKVKKHG